MRIGGSIFLLAVGAILAFAIIEAPSAIGAVSVDWQLVGYVLMAVGVLGLVWSLLMIESIRSRRTHLDEDREHVRVLD